MAKPSMLTSVDFRSCSRNVFDRSVIGLSLDKGNEMAFLCAANLPYSDAPISRLTEIMRGGISQ